MANSGQKGPSFSGGGLDITPLPRTLETVGLAYDHSALQSLIHEKIVFLEVVSIHFMV